MSYYVHPTGFQRKAGITADSREDLTLDTRRDQGGVICVIM